MKRTRTVIGFWYCLLVALMACICSTYAEAADMDIKINDKTLVVWASPADLDQKGGSVLTIEKPGEIFDGIVFGEVAASKWMAGSNAFSL